jgi:hypothetical protein
LESKAPPTIDDRGVLYIGDMDGYLYAFGADVPDVGVVSLDMPAEIVPGRIHLPRATVRNYRTGSESFAVACVIDTLGHPVYSDTLFVSSLAETTSAFANFAPWNVALDTGVVYNVTVATLLTGDNNAHNDIRSATVGATDNLATGAGGGRGVAPPNYWLGQSYPNPFNASARVDFSIGEAAHVILKVYNPAGQLIRTLVDETRPQGYYNDAVWDGRDMNGRLVSSGIYFYRLVAGDFSRTRKLVLLR